MLNMGYARVSSLSPFVWSWLLTGCWWDTLHRRVIVVCEWAHLQVCMCLYPHHRRTHVYFCCLKSICFVPPEGPRTTFVGMSYEKWHWISLVQQLLNVLSLSLFLCTSLVSENSPWETVCLKFFLSFPYMHLLSNKQLKWNHNIEYLTIGP